MKNLSIIDENNIKNTKARCPECRSKDIDITEEFQAYTVWEQNNGQINFEEGYHNAGAVTGVFGYCRRCDHRWKFRVLQITNLFIEE